MTKYLLWKESPCTSALYFNVANQLYKTYFIFFDIVIDAAAAPAADVDCKV